MKPRRRTQPRWWVWLGSFSGSFTTTGILGLASHNGSHHPVLDTVFVVLGSEGLVLLVYLYYREFRSRKVDRGSTTPLPPNPTPKSRRRDSAAA